MSLYVLCEIHFIMEGVGDGEAAAASKVIWRSWQHCHGGNLQPALPCLLERSTQVLLKMSSP